MKTNNRFTKTARPAELNVHVWNVLRKVATEIRKSEGEGSPWKNKVMVSCKEFYNMLLDQNGQLILQNKELIHFAQNAHIKKWANEVMLDGINLLANEAYDLALEKFELYSSMLPNDASGYFYLAKALHSKMQHRQALVNINSAIQLEPQCAKYYTMRASIWSSIDQDEKAKSDLDFAILLEPYLAQAYFARSIIYQTMGDSKLAIKDLKKAIELRPEEVNYYLALGNSFLQLAKNPEAYGAFRKVLTINPFNAEALYQCASIKIELDIEVKTAEDDLWMARSLGHPNAENLLLARFYPGWDLPLSNVA